MTAAARTQTHTPPLVSIAFGTASNAGGLQNGSCCTVYMLLGNNTKCIVLLNT